MPEIKTTTETETWLQAVIEAGVFAWNPETGITVPDDISDAMELLFCMLSGATTSTSRQGNDMVSITITTPGSSQIFMDLMQKFGAAKASFDELEPEDGYCP